MEINKKKYILFPKLDLKYLLFLFFFIVSIIRSLMKNYIEDNEGLSVEFLELYINIISDFISIIPVLIILKRTKSTKNDTRMTIKDKFSNLILKTSEEQVKVYKGGAFIKLLIFTTVDFFSQVSSRIFYIIINVKKITIKLTSLNSTLIFNIIFIFLLSKIMLHTNFFRHNYFSLIIDIICLIVLIIIDIIDIKNNSGKLIIIIIYIFIKIFGTLLYSLEDVLSKILFLYYYYSPYTLLVYKGIFTFCYLIIFSLPFIFIELNNEKGEKKLVFSMILNIFEDWKNILFAIFYTISSFFYNIIILKIIDSFSPNHFVIAKVLENFEIIIINIILNGADSQKYLAVKITLNILLIFSSLIYNEFLVINICGLSKSTKLFLNYEAQLEILPINKNNKDDEGTCEDEEESESMEILSVKSVNNTQ